MKDHHSTTFALQESLFYFWYSYLFTLFIVVVWLRIVCHLRNMHMVCVIYLFFLIHHFLSYLWTCFHILLLELTHFDILLIIVLFLWNSDVIWNICGKMCIPWQSHMGINRNDAIIREIFDEKTNFFFANVRQWYKNDNFNWKDKLSGHQHTEIYFQHTDILLST